MLRCRTVQFVYLLHSTLASDRICSLDENCNANMVTAFSSCNARYYKLKLEVSEIVQNNKANM